MKTRTFVINTKIFCVIRRTGIHKREGKDGRRGNEGIGLLFRKPLKGGKKNDKEVMHFLSLTYLVHTNNLSEIDVASANYIFSSKRNNNNYR